MQVPYCTLGGSAVYFIVYESIQEKQRRRISYWRSESADTAPAVMAVDEDIDAVLYARCALRPRRPRPHPGASLSAAVRPGRSRTSDVKRHTSVRCATRHCWCVVRWTDPPPRLHTHCPPPRFLLSSPPADFSPRPASSAGDARSHSDVLAERVTSLAAQLHCDLADKAPVFLAVMSGAFVFAADLLRAMPRVENAVVETIKASSYFGSETSGEVKVNASAVDVAGRHVVLIEDIVDTGLTLEALKGGARRRAQKNREGEKNKSSSSGVMLKHDDEQARSMV